MPTGRRCSQRLCDVLHFFDGEQDLFQWQSSPAAKLLTSRAFEAGHAPVEF